MDAATDVREPPATRVRLLEAASQIVRSRGVAELTLEAVAAGAGVSKGGLLYHFGTKEALVIALLGDALDRADAELDRSTSGPNASAPGSFARSYLDFVRDRRHDSGPGVGVLAAATLAEGDLGPARERFRDWHSRLRNDGIDPVTALLVRTVADGLWLLDLFDLAPPDDEERTLLFDHLDMLLGGAP